MECDRAGCASPPTLIPRCTSRPCPHLSPAWLHLPQWGVSAHTWHLSPYVQEPLMPSADSQPPCGPPPTLGGANWQHRPPPGGGPWGRGPRTLEMSLGHLGLRELRGSRWPGHGLEEETQALSMQVPLAPWAPCSMGRVEAGGWPQWRPRQPGPGPRDGTRREVTFANVIKEALSGGQA